MQKVFVPVLAFLALFSVAVNASTMNYSFTGNFQSDNDVQLFHFSVDDTSDVVLRTWSYAGGVNAAGQAIVRGGFDPILALFNASGSLINQNDDGGYGVVAADAVTNMPWDTYLTAHLDAGNYTVAVMQYANFAPSNLNDAFPGAGVTNFRDVSGDLRSNFWAFDILNVARADVVGVPESSGLAMLGFGLICLGFLRRKKVAA